DRGKRLLMGQAATAGADWVMVTSDNPRGEDPNAIIHDICPQGPPAEGGIETRTLHPGDVYYALRGERLDGHDFVVAALQAGAAAAVIAADELARFPPALHSRLRPVADPLASLQALAREHRRAWGGPLVAITGSAGKTTTKEMTAAVLATKLRVMKSPG